MIKAVKTVIGLGLLGSTLLVQAADMKTVESNIRQQVAVLGLNVSSVAESPVDGLYQVFTNRGLFFMSADGRYFMEGNIYDLQQQQLVNDVAMRAHINDSLASYQNSVIEYKAKDEKYVVTVFTDPTCGFCRKLHNEMKDYNNAGITIRYLAFPRGGLSSDTYLQMQHIWCSKNPQKAMDDAKAGSKTDAAMCQNKVKEHYALGQSFGISGTPAMILPNGQLVAGYQPAAKLLEQLTAVQQQN